jgi:GxxExxY protein
LGVVTEEQEDAAKTLLDCAFKTHNMLGPGLLERTYRTYFAFEARLAGLRIDFVDCQNPQPVCNKGVGLSRSRVQRVGMLVGGGKIIVENQSVKELTDIHFQQLLTYMKSADVSLGFLINWNVRDLKNGINRVAL